MTRKQERYTLDKEVIDEINSRCKGVDKSKWVNDFFRKELFKEKGKDKVEVKSNGEEKLQDLFDKALMQDFQSNPGIVKTLDNETKAKLILARLPKKEGDIETEKEYLSLTNCLKEMASIEDVFKELGDTKKELSSTKDKLAEQTALNWIGHVLVYGHEKRLLNTAVLRFLTELEVEVNGYIRNMKARSYDELQEIRFSIPDSLRKMISEL